MYLVGIWVLDPSDLGSACNSAIHSLSTNQDPTIMIRIVLTRPKQQITITKMTNLSHRTRWNPMEGLFIDVVSVSITLVTDESVGHVTLHSSISRQTFPLYFPQTWYHKWSSILTVCVTKTDPVISLLTPSFSLSSALLHPSSIHQSCVDWSSISSWWLCGLLCVILKIDLKANIPNSSRCRAWERKVDYLAHFIWIVRHTCHPQCERLGGSPPKPAGFPNRKDSPTTRMALQWP